jgi:ankyrin repeat domain-containing protein 50
MTDLLTGLDRVLYLINRCKVYEALYIRSQQPTAAKLAVENLRRGLVQLYLAIQRFIARALVLFKKNTLSRGSQAFIRPGDVSELDKRFQEWEKQVEVEAENCERFQNSASRVEIVQNAERLKCLLTKMDSQDKLLMTMDIKLTAIWNSIAEDERLELLKWASDIPYQDNHNFARKGHTPGTGDWLLNHPRYLQWNSSEKSIILWLHGIRKFGLITVLSEDH